MRVTAVLCARESGAYLSECLAHLVANGVDYVIIDNGLDASDRDTLKEPRFQKNLVDNVSSDYSGSEPCYFQGILERASTIPPRSSRHP